MWLIKLLVAHIVYANGFIDANLKLREGTHLDFGLQSSTLKMSRSVKVNNTDVLPLQLNLNYSDTTILSSFNPTGLNVPAEKTTSFSKEWTSSAADLMAHHLEGYIENCIESDNFVVLKAMRTLFQLYEDRVNFIHLKWMY